MDENQINQINDARREGRVYYFDYRAYKKLYQDLNDTFHELWDKNHGHEVVLDPEKREWRTVQTNVSSWVCFDNHPQRDTFIVEEKPKPLTNKELLAIIGGK